MKTCLEQSYFQDYKDGIILKFIENTVWSALRFRERKLHFFKLKLSLEKDFLKQNRETYQVSVIWSFAVHFFSQDVERYVQKTHTLFLVSTKKNEKDKFLKMADQHQTWLSTRSTRQSIMFSPGPCPRLVGLVFRENVFNLFIFSILLGNE